MRRADGTSAAQRISGNLCHPTVKEASVGLAGPRFSDAGIAPRLECVSHGAHSQLLIRVPRVASLQERHGGVRKVLAEARGQRAACGSGADDHKVRTAHFVALDTARCSLGEHGDLHCSCQNTKREHQTSYLPMQSVAALWWKNRICMLASSW